MRPPRRKTAHALLAAATGREIGLLEGQTGEHATTNPNEQFEFGTSRRAFLVWALMCGAVPPERVVERVVAEVEADVRREFAKPPA